MIYNLGYTNNGNSANGKSTLLTPEFLLSLANCWTMFVSNDSNQVNIISKSGNLIASEVYNNNNLICPVINLVRPGYEVVGSTNTGMNKPIIYAIIGIIITICSCGIYIAEKYISKKRNNKQ